MLRFERQTRLIETRSHTEDVQASGTERENAVTRLDALPAKHPLDERDNLGERGVVLGRWERRYFPLSPLP